LSVFFRRVCFGFCCNTQFPIIEFEDGKMNM
jgi:hypothetical protein